MSVVNEELGYAPECTLVYHLGLLEQRPYLRLACLLCEREVFVQA